MQTTDRQFLEAIGASDPPEVAESMEDLLYIALMRERQEHAHSNEVHLDMLANRADTIATLKRRYNWQNLALFAMACIVLFLLGRK